MNLSVLLTGALMALSLLILFLLLFFHNTKHIIRSKRLLELLLISALIYIFGYVLELTANVESQKIFYNHFQYIGLVMIAPIWYLISVRFSHLEGKWQKLKPLLFVIPVIALIGNFTHTSNQYFYQSHIYSITNSGLHVILYEKGVLYFVHNAYQSVLAALSALNYYNVYKTASGMCRKQAAVLLGLSILGFLTVASCHFSYFTSNFDSATLFVGASAFILLLTLFKYRLFDLLPAAYMKVFQSIDTPILILDDAKTIIEYNAAAVNVFGNSLRKFRKLSEAFADDTELLNALDNNQSCIINRTVDGRQMYFSTKLIKLDKKIKEYTNEYGYLLTFANETEHVNKVLMLENAAFIDPLTEVYNRRYFFEKASQAIEDAKKGESEFSLIMLDIDRFKSVNDTFGHVCGDFVLKKVCAVMQEHITSADMAARFGGEEFIMLLRGADFDQATETAERICRGIREQKILYEEETIAVSVSVGVFTPEFPLPAFATLDKLIAAVDNCLYNAKKEGGDRVYGANGAVHV